MNSFPCSPILDDAAQGADILDVLRRLSPDRALSWSESHSIAERQAKLLLELVHVDEPPVPQFVICNLPGVLVDWREDWPTEAVAFKTNRWWRIVIRSSDVRQRQRFSLAHELKHVIDDPIIDRLFRHLPEEQRQSRAERLCNYFASCFLMPRTWLKHDWYGGMQKRRILARRYYVSEEAMSTRLSELGLTRVTWAERQIGRRSVGVF